MRATLGSCAASVAAAALLLLPAAGSQAQTPATPSEKTPNAATPASISDTKLDATAKAVKSVSAIRESYEQKLAKAPATDKGKLVDEATNAMTKAVTDQGLSVDEYTS